MKHKQPENVRAYFNALKIKIPECCHTCDHYADDGFCLKYEMEPPEDFAAAEGECPEWEELIPF